MNSAQIRVAPSRSLSDSDSQSARSRLKSMSAGSQNLALPPANSFNGRLSQLRPPARSEPSRVLFMMWTSSSHLFVGFFGVFGGSGDRVRQRVGAHQRRHRGTRQHTGWRQPAKQ